MTRIDWLICVIREDRGFNFMVVVSACDLLLSSLSFPTTPYIEELSSHVFDKSYYPQANSAHAVNRRSFDCSYQPIFRAKPNDRFNDRTG
jgi:hypothetical protein